MKHYYFADNDQQFGPFTIEELKSKRLKKTTLVWTDGMEDWNTAESIAELKDIVISEPPPIPKSSPTLPKPLPNFETVSIKHTPAPTPVFSSKYDLNYEKEYGATVIGIILSIGTLFLNLRAQQGAFTNEEWSLLVISYFLIRIPITIWVILIAFRQNRSTIGWGFFAFCLPSWSLTVIGLLRKVRLKIVLDGNMPVNLQTDILYKKACNLFSHNRHSECVEVLNKAIEIHNSSFDCIKLRALANYELKNYEKSKLDFDILIKNETHLSGIDYYLSKLVDKTGGTEKKQ